MKVGCRAGKTRWRDGGVDWIRIAENALVLGTQWQVRQRPDRQLDLYKQNRERKKCVVIIVTSHTFGWEPRLISN